MGINNGIANLVLNCAQVVSGDRVLIICNDSTLAVANKIEAFISNITDQCEKICTPELLIHGEEPNADVATKMLSSNVIFGLTKMSMAHTIARQNATLKGIKYLSLPDYDENVLSRDAMSVDFTNIVPQAILLADRLTNASEIRITSELGTDLRANLFGRVANVAPGLCNDTCLLASPPDAEVNIAPIEESSNGVIVVDGSIPHPLFGILKDHLILEVANGYIVNVKGSKCDVYKNVYANDPENAKILAEIGIGLNPKAELSGTMLEDEGCYGTIHFGFGSNATIGGKNNVKFHMDHVIRKPILFLDGVSYGRI